MSPRPSCPLEFNPQPYTRPFAERNIEKSLPAWMSTIGSSKSNWTGSKRFVSECLSCLRLKPNCPNSPLPDTNTFPYSLRYKVWFEEALAFTMPTCYLARWCTRVGVSTLVSCLPRPNAPYRLVPHAKTKPLAVTAMLKLFAQQISVTFVDLVWISEEKTKASTSVGILRSCPLMPSCLPELLPQAYTRPSVVKISVCWSPQHTCFTFSAPLK